MTVAVEPLAWDTDFFGLPIGRVDLDGATPADLDEVEVTARRLGLRCVYGSLDPADRGASVRAQGRGWILLDVATTLELALAEPPIPAPPGIETRPAVPADHDALLPMARTLGPWSRFAIDPRFGLDAAVRLQEAWLARILDPTAPAHSALVATRDGEVTALIGQVDDGRRRVDGMATTERGSGAARYLMEVARGWAGAAPLLLGPVMARNVAALRWASHCGCRVRTVRDMLHLWLDP